MFKKSIFFIISAVIAVSALAQAQEDNKPAAEEKEKEKEKEKPGEPNGPARFWQAKLNGGLYMVALDHISSISRHQYLLDGAVIVDEVTVDSIGQALARFYVIRPATDLSSSAAAKSITQRATDLLEKGADRVGSDISTMVVKKYPETTHARTIEYRLLQEQELTSLFNSLKNAWETGKGRVFTSK